MHHRFISQGNIKNFFFKASLFVPWMSFLKDVVIICLDYCWHSRKFPQIQQLQIGKAYVMGSMESVNPHGHTSTPIHVNCLRNHRWWCIFKLLIVVVILLDTYMTYIKSWHISYNPGMFTLHVCLDSSMILFIFSFKKYKRISTCLNLCSYKWLAYLRTQWNFAHQQQQKQLSHYIYHNTKERKKSISEN